MDKSSKSTIMIYLEGLGENVPIFFIGEAMFDGNDFSGRALGVSRISLRFILEGKSTGSIIQKFKGSYGANCISMILGGDIKIELIMKPAFRAGKLYLFAGNYQSNLTFGAAYVIRM
jgi:hypothetical protein